LPFDVQLSFSALVDGVLTLVRSANELKLICAAVSSVARPPIARTETVTFARLPKPSATLKASFLASTALIAAFTVLSSPAAAQVWDGDTDSNWTEDTNWAGDVQPVAAGDAVLDTAVGNQPTLGAADTVTVNTVGVSAGTLTIDGTLTATNGTTISGGTVIVNGFLEGANSIGALGTLTNSGFVDGVDNAGIFANTATGDALAVTNSGTGTNAGIVASLDNTGGTFGNAGEITGTLDVTGGVVTNDATGTVLGASTVGAAGTLSNDGTVADVDNAGIFANSLTAGAVTNSGTGTNAGTVRGIG